MSIKKILLNLDLYLGCCILIVLVIVAVATVIGARLGHCFFYDWAY